MNNRKLVYVGFAFQHHKGTHAGYNQIKDYINYDYIIDCQSYIEKKSSKSCNIFKRIKRKLFVFLFQTAVVRWYIFKVLWLGITKTNLTFHVVYGENLYCSLFRLIRKSNKVVCTLHQPAEWFEKSSFWRSNIKHIDKIILVGNTEIELFKQMSGRSNIVYIPHGISSSFYKPDNNVKKEHLLLTVGNWLRDYKFANRVYQKLLQEDKDLKIVVVSNPKNKILIEENERIEFLSGITDEELLLLYRKCSVLFLPLIRYTANNSLLEAGACGCNIVISSNYPDNSYIPQEYVTLCNMNESVVHNIEQAMTTTYNFKLSQYILDHYSWETICTITKDELV